MGAGTMTAQILERHGIADPTPGSFALLELDRLMVNDVTGAIALDVFDQIGADRVFDPAKVSCIADHFLPAKDIASATHVARLRAFAERYGIENLAHLDRIPRTGARISVGVVPFKRGSGGPAKVLASW